jgi:hypothetical protein
MRQGRCDDLACLPENHPWVASADLSLAKAGLFPAAIFFKIRERIDGDQARLIRSQATSEF